MTIELDFDTDRSLVELGAALPEPDAYADHHAGMLYKLCTMPLRKLAPGHLLALARENVALPCVAPLALARLEQDPFLEAEEHPGDLLTALLQADPAFWGAHRTLWEQTLILAAEVVTDMNARMAEGGLGDYLPHFAGDDFVEALLHFRNLHEVDR